MRTSRLLSVWGGVLAFALILGAAPFVRVTAQDTTPQPPTEATPEIVPRGPMITVPMEGIRAHEGEGFIRFVQASSDAGSVDLYLNSQIAAPAIAFSSGSDFLPQPAGTYTLEVRAAGDTTDTTPLFTSEIVIAPGVSTTLVALGSVDGQGQQAFKVKSFLTERAPTMGKARLEVIHASPDAPALDTLLGGNPVLTGIRFGHIADAPLNLPAGTYNPAFVDNETKQTVLDMDEIELAADTIYTVIVIGTVSDNSLGPLILTTVSAG